MTFEEKLKFVVYFKQIIKMCPGVSIVDLKQASAGWEAKGFPVCLLLVHLLFATIKTKLFI